MAKTFSRTPPIRRASPMSKSKARNFSDAGLLVVIFLAVAIGGALLLTVTNQTTAESTTQTVINKTVTLPTAAGGTTTNLAGRDLVSTTSITASGNVSQDWSDNVTLSSGIDANGTATVILTLDGTNSTSATGGTGFINGSTANITYVANPYGFVKGTAQTLITGLLTLLLAIGILVTVIVYFYKGGSLKNLLRRK